LGVKADDLLDTLHQKALEEVRSRHELPDDESEKIAHTIAVGALRYFLLRFARNTIIAFDFKEALNFEGETGPYIQYTVVRANNIFNKLAESGETAPDLRQVDSAIGDFLVANEDIWELVYQAARLSEVVRQVTGSLELAQLCKYAHSLAKRFNTFYHKHHILSEKDSGKKQHLLLVTDIVRKQLQYALYLIGSNVPPRM
jgi:arginyl-tRNA synthetase